MVESLLTVASGERQSWLDAIATPGLVTDADGQILAWNRAAETALGWSFEQVRSGDPGFIAESAWRTLAASLDDPAMASEWGTHELSVHRADDREAATHLAVVRRSGQPGAAAEWAVFFTDLRTDERKLTGHSSLIDTALAHGQDSWLGEQVRRMAQRAEIFERILHRSPGILLVLRHEPHWPVEYVSNNIDRFGYEPDALLSGATRLSEIFHPDDLGRSQSEVEYWCDQTSVEDFRLEFRWMTRQGEARWMDTHLWLRRDAQGQVKLLQGIAWDITSRKRSEARNKLTTHVVEVLNCPQESGEALRNVLEVFREHGGIEAAAIDLHRGNGHFDCEHAGFGEYVPLSPAACPLLERLSGGVESGERHRGTCSLEPRDGRIPAFTCTQGGSAWSNDASGLSCSQCTRSNARGGWPKDGPGSFCSIAFVPLRAGGRVLGMLQLCDHRPNLFDRDAVEAFESLGYSIGIALDRESATRQLQASEERYRALFDTSRDGVLMYALDGRIEMANTAVLGLMGRPLQVLRSMNPWDFLRNAPAMQTAVCQPGKLFRDGYTDDHEREIIRPDGSTVTVVSNIWIVRDESGSPVRQLEVLRDVSREREAERKIRRLATAIEQSADSVLITDAQGRIEYVNPAFESTTGYSSAEAMGMHAMRLRSREHSIEAYRELRDALRKGEAHSGRFVLRRRDGSRTTIDNMIAPVRGSGSRITNFVAAQRDVTKITQLEMQLLQAQKLESIGRLAASIAHEINTPSQYVGDNVRFLKEAFEDYDRVMAAGRALALAATEQDQFPAELEAIRSVIEEADLDYLAEEIPRAIDQSLDGLSRISHIVGAMKYFSHPGADGFSLVDLHKAIESTVTVARNEWKYVADLELEFDPTLPLVPCLPNDFNQVVLNLVINAAHAIQAKTHGPDEKGRIVVRTRATADTAIIEIEDSGTGIPEFAIAKVFDPFFTTKRVGRGTGQGLALAHDVIVNRHGGQIDFETELGKGTTFRVRLPLQSPMSAPADHEGSTA